MDKDIKEVLISEEQLRARIAEMGVELSRDYAGKNPVIVGVLKGVVMFYADMVRQIKVPCEMEFMAISSYCGIETTGKPVIKKDVGVDLTGRHVLILEDIYDTGTSLNATYNYLMEKNPASIKICTLLDKPARRKPQYTLRADYVGFTIPDEFVVGYGLDFNEKYRNLPYVGILKPEAYDM